MESIIGVWVIGHVLLAFIVKTIFKFDDFIMKTATNAFVVIVLMYIGFVALPLLITAGFELMKSEASPKFFGGIHDIWTYSIPFYAKGPIVSITAIGITTVQCYKMKIHNKRVRHGLISTVGFSEELAKMPGITMGGSYKDIVAAYKKMSHPLNNEHTSKEVHFRATYEYPLIPLRGAGKTTYEVFRGNILSCGVRISPINGLGLDDRIQEIRDYFTVKYGEPIPYADSFERNGEMSLIDKHYNCRWKANDLEIYYTPVKLDGSAGYVRLDYNYVNDALGEAFDEYLQSDESY